MTDESNIDLAGVLQWGRLLVDSKVLKSGDREQLKTYLEQLLQGLSQRYTAKSSQAFPSAAELTRLTEVVMALAKVLGIKKSRFGILHSAMKRIENRWNKMPLIAFADDLLKRVLNLPRSPHSVVHKAAKDCNKKDKARRQQLEEIKILLSGKGNADAKLTCWEDWFDAIQALNFPTSIILSRTNPSVVSAARF